MARVTIADIARRANVSTSAVSYALNDRPGVGEVTRQQILDIARSMGWRPNRAARALQAARAHAVGLVFQRSANSAEEASTFLLRFLDGVENELSEHDIVLVVHAVHDLPAEIEVYERWYAENRVDGVVVINPVVDDPRLPALQQIGLPAVVVGDVRGHSPLPAVWTDDAEAATLAVEHLAALGHRRIARVGGGLELLHTRIRKAAFGKAIAAARLGGDLSVDNATEDDAERITKRLLARKNPPTAILYESDAMAMRGLVTLRELGLLVPRDLSVMVWDDSPMCRLAYPPLTALRRDAFAYGRLVAEHLLTRLSGEPVSDRRGTVAEIRVRKSTGPAPSTVDGKTRQLEPRR